MDHRNDSRTVSDDAGPPMFFQEIFVGSGHVDVRGYRNRIIEDIIGKTDDRVYLHDVGRISVQRREGAIQGFRIEALPASRQ